MGTRALLLSSSHNYCCLPSLGVSQNLTGCRPSKVSNTVGVWAKLDEEKGKKGEAKESKQSLFGSLTEALDFSQVRSAEDAQLLDEARDATKGGGRMNREQVKPTKLKNSTGFRLGKSPSREIRQV